MSLSSAFNIINSSFNANASQTAAISSNISNASTTGYTLKTANLATNSYGGVEVSSITRATNVALLEQMLAANSTSAQQSALANGLTQLSATVNDSTSVSSSSSTTTASGQSPSAMLANLDSALQNYEASPSDATVAQSVITAASQLTSSLNSATATVQQVRSQADAGMATSVATINSLLGQFQTVNNTIVSGLQSGADVTDAEDSRDNILSQLSQQIGISTVTSANGSESIYTDSGVTLFQTTARAVTFTATPTLTAGASGNAVIVDGVPITGSSSPMAIQSGALAGLATLRDTVAPQYQAQLDQIASGLINAFAETNQANPATPDPLPGLFTYPGVTSATVLPTATTVPAGLAGQIEVNASVDPSQGGNANLLRDGGIANTTAGEPTGDTDYTYNTTGAASYTTRIQQMISGISATQSFDPTAGAGSSDSLTAYADASVSWVQGQYQQASDQATSSSALATTASQALSSATGVSLDNETSQMLSLENSYQTTAKLLTTVNNMFSSLLTAVTAVLPA
ncbi:flagellar hook-associated protein FlgK [Methylocapsa sp. S129]|uniref:flagellar hook-associated protein FlgK n=1 Tax=Methylocapsa sp. S129 TaxID=1641869 RepID=UPI00131CB364|nr:flagellar hook-associated protein FlgK [Methylocapsa sp. S129]